MKQKSSERTGKSFTERSFPNFPPSSTSEDMSKQVQAQATIKVPTKNQIKLGDEANKKNNKMSFI